MKNTEILQNYHSTRHFLQTVNIPSKSGPFVPFMYMKNHNCACATILTTILQKMDGLSGDQTRQLDVKTIHRPSQDYVLTGPRGLKVEQATQIFNADSHFKFTVMRDPLERTVSAFADKILKGDKQKTKLMKHLKRPVNSDISLSEFLDIIANDPQAFDLDRHWRPQRKEISFDYIPFDYIGDMSDLVGSMNYVGKRIFDTDLSLADTHIEFGNKSASQELIEEMTAQDRKNIENILEMDFEMHEIVKKSFGDTQAIVKPNLASIPKPPDKPETERASWLRQMKEVGDENGFFEQIGKNHSGLFLKQGKTLIVTFENLDHVDQGGGDRMPWGFEFVKKQGWSMLGMMAHDWTWYRDEAVFDFFDRLRDEGFYDQFDNVVFYGASMGGYAASVFSSSCPGSKVIMISPQATIDPKTVPWETRYKKAKNLSFSGRYSFAPDYLEQASNAYIFIDPHHSFDKKHAALFKDSNAVVYHSHFCGHRQASLWQQFGILKPIVQQCVEGTLTSKKFYHMLRARKDNTRYRKEMVARLEKKGRDLLLVNYCKAVLARNKGPFFRKAKNAAQKRLDAKAKS